MSEYVPTTEEVRAGWMTSGPPSSTVVRALDFERWLDQVRAAARREGQAEALREAVDEFENHVGVGEFVAQTTRDGRYWSHAAESWEHQGPFMSWLINRADRIENGAGQ